ncbi:MAG: PAS domain S-box protein [Desulfobacteraceae bacterium]|nr:PAS domain S-box protein [Desulfobacteraceae bacterium]
MQGKHRPIAGSDAGRGADEGESRNDRLTGERYRVLIEDVADGFFETDLKGSFKFFNDALCRIFGRDRTEIQNRSFRHFMDAGTAERAFQDFNAIYRTGIGRTGLVWEILRKDGSHRMLEISGNLIVDDNDAVQGFRGIARDITEKHRAEEALKESEQCTLQLYEVSRRAERRYRAFLEFLPDPVFVFNLDSTVSYLNPAFERVFGWTLEELKGKRIPFVPDHLKEETRRGIEKLFREKVIHGSETQRLTKDGRLLDVVVDGAIFYDEDERPAGQVVTFRDVTQQRRTDRNHQALFRIAKALYQFRGLDERLDFITHEVQELMAAEGALVILIDEKRQEFFFRAAAYEDMEAEKRYREIRYPLDKGVAGEVYRTGKPLVVGDYYNSPYFFQDVDERTGSLTRNMLDVPMWTEDRMIGVLCAVNKKEGHFDQTDVDLLITIASIVALPVVNASINEELNRSFEAVKSLNRAKDRVIHHLSHELKTPVSVLDASIGLLKKRLDREGVSGVDRVMERARRNLQRLLEMQYEIEDILRGRDYAAHPVMTRILEACTDELEALALQELGEEDFARRIRERIDELFGPRDAVPERLRLQRAVRSILSSLAPRFAHRKVEVRTQFASDAEIWLPPDVLQKIVTGLIRNAVENTPDGGRISVSVKPRAECTDLVIADCGVGITEENRRLIFENYFSTYETSGYSTGTPFDFGAGGKGFDLLRMKIFSERYGFDIHLESRRCRFLPEEEDRCPGDMGLCAHCSQLNDCLESGGTVVTVSFPDPDKAQQGKGGGACAQEAAPETSGGRS